MRLCVDELFTDLIAEQLRERGHDVIHVHERPGLSGTPDEILVEAMTHECRAILTANVADFQQIAMCLAAESREHAGMLFTSDRSMPRSRNTTGAFVRALDAYLTQHAAADALVNRIEWLAAPTASSAQR
jgi:predicted nuclease of predicted toxin-antitoxin system